MAQMPTIQLNDGNTIPQLGMGVWQVDPGITARVVEDGIRAGYRLIDTAEGYNNEEGVGEAIRRSEVPREALFVTSKLRSGAHARDEALKSFDATMKALGLEQLDMFLIHWPVPGQNKYVEAWRTLVELQNQMRAYFRNSAATALPISLAPTVLAPGAAKSAVRKPRARAERTARRTRSSPSSSSKL